jgi:DNA helicase-2/ATP-dependent DNA helicase PcrA
MDGVLPTTYALTNKEDIEEEHRLLYVGVTRAKKRLFLSLHHYGSTGGITQFNKISRFLDVPNVLSKLDVTISTKPNTIDVSDEPRKVIPIINKQSLFDKIMSLFK